MDLVLVDLRYWSGRAEGGGEVFEEPGLGRHAKPHRMTN